MWVNNDSEMLVEENLHDTAVSKSKVHPILQHYFWLVWTRDPRRDKNKSCLPRDKQNTFGYANQSPGKGTLTKDLKVFRNVAARPQCNCQNIVPRFESHHFLVPAKRAFTPSLQPLLCLGCPIFGGA